MATLLFACVVGVTSCKKGKESVSSEPTESVSGSEVSGEVSVTISSDSVTVSENEYVTLSATVEGSDEAVIWSTSDKNVAEVNEKAGFTALSAERRK